MSAQCLDKNEQVKKIIIFLAAEIIIRTMLGSNTDRHLSREIVVDNV